MSTALENIPARVTSTFSLSPGYVRGLAHLAEKYPHSEQSCTEYRDRADVGWLRAVVTVRRGGRSYTASFVLSPTGAIWREPDYWQPSEELRSPVERDLEQVRDQDYVNTGRD